MPLLVFLPLLIGSIIGLSFVLMLLSRVMFLPLYKSNLMNKVSQILASGNREKAIIILEEDNHPVSNILSHTFKHSASSGDDLRGIFEFASLESEKRLIYGTRTLAWLTAWVPAFSVLMYFLIPVKPSASLLLILKCAALVEIAFWVITIIYVKLKVQAIIRQANDQFSLLSGLAVDELAVTQGLIETADDIKDIVDFGFNRGDIKGKSADKSGKKG